MNKKAFTNFLATGDYVPTMDADLASHDKHWHPNGFDPDKDHCGLRDQMAKKDDADDLSGMQAETSSSSEASELETAKNVLAKLSAERGDDNKYEWKPTDLQGETGYTVFAGSGRVRSKDLEEALQGAGIKTARAHLLPGNKLLVTGIGG